MRMDLAICILEENKEKKHVFCAPEYTMTDNMDVIVDTCKGKKLAKVVAHLSGVDEDDEEVKFIRAIIGIKEPFRRVISKVRYYDLNYEEGEIDE